MKIYNRNSSQLKPGWQILLLMLVCGIIGSSHGQTKNEISLYMQGSFSKLDYEVFQENSDMENGFGFGAGYSYYLSENWSIGTGAELQYFEGSAYLSSVEDVYSTLDMEGEEFEFRYQLKDFRENQYAYYLNVPLKIQYETGNITRFYAAAGAKLGFEIQSEYEASASSLTTSGYYEQYDVELSAPGFSGFGNFGPMNASRLELGLVTNLVLNMEAGVKFMLENDRAFYMGLFLDYGLKDIKPEENQGNLIAYNSEDPVDLMNGSMLSSINNKSFNHYVDEVKTLAFGLKIQYAFQF
ncbi:hypothetical protein [Salinimicrobium marinum]|nr:hypothetical protein [Salinimicrobium marinum]